MATMNISLPDELKQFIDAQVSEHGYGSTSEYLRDLIRKQRDVEKLRGMLLEGVNSGPATPNAHTPAPRANEAPSLASAGPARCRRGRRLVRATRRPGA